MENETTKAIEEIVKKELDSVHPESVTV